jgi:hypothetical protein
MNMAMPSDVAIIVIRGEDFITILEVHDQMCECGGTEIKKLVWWASTFRENVYHVASRTWLR